MALWTGPRSVRSELCLKVCGVLTSRVLTVSDSTCGIVVLLGSDKFLWNHFHMM